MSGYLWRGTPGLALLNAQIMAERPDPDRPRFGPNEAPHGTHAAYRRHRRNGEPPCESCSAAECRRMVEYRARKRRVA